MGDRIQRNTHAPRLRRLAHRPADLRRPTPARARTGASGSRRGDARPTPGGRAGCIPHGLPGLAAHRLDGCRSRLFGHALEWGDGDRLVDEPVDAGGERAYSTESDHPSRAEVNHPSQWGARWSCGEPSADAGAMRDPTNCMPASVACWMM